MDRRATWLVSLAGLLAGCSDGASEGYSLPASEAAAYDSAYVSRVVAAPPGSDIVQGGGEYLVIEQNAEIRVDMGGWWVEDMEGNRLSLGVGRQIDEGADVRLYSSCGVDTPGAVFACAGTEVLDDRGDTLTLRDAAGAAVAKLTYGDGPR